MTPTREELTRVVCLELRLPGLPVDGSPVEVSREGAARRRMRQEVEAAVSGAREGAERLGRLAGGVGAVPGGYPRHVDVVMRVVSALLPWYTRPLREFASGAAEQARRTAEALERIERALEAGQGSAGGGE